MRSLFSLLLGGLLMILSANLAASGKYDRYQHNLFTVEVPADWHIISRKQLNDLISEQVKRQGLSVRQNWQVYECGFQENPLTHGLSLPLITIKADTDKELSRALLRQLKTMNKAQISSTYSEAAKVLTPQIAGKILGSSVEDVFLDRNRNMIRFTLRLNNVQTMTSIYVHEETLFRIICSAASGSSADTISIFKHVSDSFRTK